MQEPDCRVDVIRYFALVEEGLIAPDDRVELLEGVIVSMSPQTPLHASGVMRAERTLRDALPAGTTIRIQMPFVAGSTSVPEPDIAVVAGGISDYIDRHPGTALLIVEIAVSSAIQNRLTKASIYAKAGIPNYWLVNLRDECVEAFSMPLADEQRYGRSEELRDDGVLRIEAFPNVLIRATDLIPRRRA
jgi:Uma2 family endonuclease